MFGMIAHPVDDLAYGIFLFLHILAVISGLGPTIAYPMFGSIARRKQGPEGTAIFGATLEVGGKLEYAIYAIPVFGIILVLLSDDAFEFTDGWIIAGILLYAVAMYVSQGLHTPNLRKMHELQLELARMGPPPEGAAAGGPPPQVVELEERGKRAGMYGGILHLSIVLLLIDMIWKPGWP